MVSSGVGRLTPLKQIDNYRDNWWCLAEDVHRGWLVIGEGNFEGMSKPLRSLYPDDKPYQAAFLSEDQKARASEEWKSLQAVGPAPNYLSQQVIGWAKKNPKDPRVSEALHLAVRCTRYGCTNKETTRFSQQAFELLHSRYPQSSWAKKTKYWY